MGGMDRGNEGISNKRPKIDINRMRTKDKPSQRMEGEKPMEKNLTSENKRARVKDNYSRMAGDRKSAQGLESEQEQSEPWPRPGKSGLDSDLRSSEGLEAQQQVRPHTQGMTGYPGQWTGW